MYFTWHVEQAMKNIRRGLETNNGTDLIITFQPKTTERAEDPPVMLGFVSHKTLKKFMQCPYSLTTIEE